MIRTKVLGTLGLVASLLPIEVAADEGMWTVNNFPADLVQKKYGFLPSSEWLDHVRLSSVRLASGCSGSFVSPDGLVLTNQHCATHCVEQVSSRSQNYVQKGFYAQSPEKEKTCPAMEINQLVGITDVTDLIFKKTQGLSDEAAGRVRKEEMSRIEKACAKSDDVRCDVVTLYNGGRYDLYRYRRFQDVRLVFAPELAIAFFGGDPDNFNFPRYNLDIAFVRIWENGKPAETKSHLKWAERGPVVGELTFVSGHPGSTNRLKTVAELAYLRDVYLPGLMVRLAELRGVLTEFSSRGKERARIAKTMLLHVENSLKAAKGRHQALVDPSLSTKTRRAEEELRRRVEAKPTLAKKYGGAWSAIEASQRELKAMGKHLAYQERGQGFHSRLMWIARLLVRHADEIEKPNAERLRELTDAKLPALKARLLSSAPIYPRLEIKTLTFSLTKLREELGPDDPFVKKVLGRKSPVELAKELVGRTQLRKVATRKRLLTGGRSAIRSSRDPMIQLALRVDSDGRKIRTRYEDRVESVVRQNSERIAKARFAVFGTANYPDATFTLRLSFGKVEGFPHLGRNVEPVTRFRGLFDRSTNKAPFALPQRWIRAKKRLDLSAQMNFVSSNDVIGGNSGSPVINRAGELAGVIFDTNIYGLGGDYGFDPVRNRSVAVDASAIRHALDQIYNAKQLLRSIAP